MSDERISYTEEDNLRTEMVARVAEKQDSRFAQALIRSGFAKNPREAQNIILFLFILTVVGSVYFYWVSQHEEPPVARDRYVRKLPAR